jgi:hypothetical protein
MQDLQNSSRIKLWKITFISRHSQMFDSKREKESKQQVGCTFSRRAEEKGI